MVKLKKEKFRDNSRIEVKLNILKMGALGCFVCVICGS